MTNAPHGRKTHVVRIVGTNKDGDVLQDIWVDVERIEEFTYRTQTTLPQFNLANQWQEIVVRLKWRDDPNGDNYVVEQEAEGDEKSQRRHEILKVCDPESDDINDPDEWVPIKVIRHVDLSHEGNTSIVQKRFVAAVVEGNRTKVENRRILHYDTNKDKDAQAAFDGDEGLKAYVMRGDEYERDDSTKDKDQYVEHEIVLHLDRKVSEHLWSSGGDQAAQMRMKNQYLIDESEEAKMDKIGSNGHNPPYRLDPFQNIINVQLDALAVEFYDGAK